MRLSLIDAFASKDRCSDVPHGNTCPAKAVTATPGLPSLWSQFHIPPGGLSRKMERVTRFERATSSLARKCSTTELHPRWLRGAVWAGHWRFQVQNGGNVRFLAERDWR